MQEELKGQIMRHQCPVCLYPELDSPPADYTICPCCGTEFGLDDDGVSHAMLREKWVKNGYRWFSNYTQPPRDWNPVKQLGMTIESVSL
jgi:hypothetical protein